MLNTILITDLDNTLYNWTDYFAPSFRSMVHVISAETGVDEDTIISEYQSVYKKYGSIEFSMSTEELPFLRDYSNERKEKLVNTARIVFGQTGRKYLLPYDGVLETLSWAKGAGIKIICVTNAPINLAEFRLQQMKMSKYIWGLAGLETDWKDEEYKGRSKQRKYWGFQKEKLNPKKRAYEIIIENIKVSPKSIYIIGDDLEKDVVPAIELGAHGIWARYGKHCNPKSLETIRKITTLKQSKTIVERDYIVPVETIIVDKFSQIQSIIKTTPQLTLKGFLIK